MSSLSCWVGVRRVYIFVGILAFSGVTFAAFNHPTKLFMCVLNT